MTLAEIIEKVEGLTGPSREVDAAIAIHFGEPHGYFEEVHLESRSYTVIEERAKRYTASLDAAIALCERVLPGWMKWLCEGHNEAGEPEWTACLIHPSKERIDAHATAATIALVLSTLRALQKDASDAG